MSTFNIFFPHDGLEDCLIQMETAIMATLAEIKAKADQTLARVQAETDIANAIKTVVDHQNTLISDLKTQIEALKNQGSASAAELQSILDTMNAAEQTDIANAQKVSEAVVAGTPSDSGGGTVPQPTPDA